MIMFQLDVWDLDLDTETCIEALVFLYVFSQ